MRWSKKVAWTEGTSIWGMWQVMQLDVDWGQIFGDAVACELLSGAAAELSIEIVAEFAKSLESDFATGFASVGAIACVSAACDVAAPLWQVRHFES